MITSRIYKSSLIIAISALIIVLISPFAFCAGQVKYYQINSDILAKGGEKAQRELGVYLPDGYDTSGEYYPVLYLIHGWTGNDRTFLGSGYGGTMSDANISLIADRLIKEGKIAPLIAVCPDVDRAWGFKGDGIIAPYDDYIAKEIVPFIDSTLRTIARRESRVIAGHSMGGQATFIVALHNPEIFSLMGIYSTIYTGPESILKNHDQNEFPFQFWIYGGRKDQFVSIDDIRYFINLLKEANLPCVYVEDDGDHTNMVAQRLEESIIFFSKFLNGSTTAIQSSGKITNTWGNIKQ